MVDRTISVDDKPVIDQGDYRDDTVVHAEYDTYGSTLTITNTENVDGTLDVVPDSRALGSGPQYNVNLGANANVRMADLDTHFLNSSATRPTFNFHLSEHSTLTITNEFAAGIAGSTLHRGGHINVDLGNAADTTFIYDVKAAVYTTVTGITDGSQIIVPGATEGSYDPVLGELIFKDSTGYVVNAIHAPGLDPDLVTFDGSTMTYACYLKGTHIATPDGETRIEDLKAGDRVLTASGGVATVKWLGHRTLRKPRIPDQDAIRAFPILFKKDSIARNRPHRDLLLSPGHHVYFDGVLIPAMLLVNGRTIIQRFDMKVFEYFHIELEQFDIVLAEGVPAESYVDTGNRAMFQNAATAARDPDYRPAGGRPEIDGIEVVHTGPAVEAVRKRLLLRAQAMTRTVRVADPNLRVEVDGQEIRAQSGNPREGVIRFALPACAAAGDLRIRSRSAVVRETSIHARRDLRQVGVGLVRITIEEQGDRRDLNLLDAQLGGLHAPQDVHGVAMRWTNGEAVVPTALHGIRGPAVLELHVLRTYSYWDDALQRAA